VNAYYANNQSEERLRSDLSLPEIKVRDASRENVAILEEAGMLGQRD